MEGGVMRWQGDFDVLIVGGGLAGVVAAVAAARNGVKTALIERGWLVGGAATAGMVSMFLSFHNMKGDKVAEGIAQEIVDRLLDKGGAIPPGHLFNPFGHAYSVTPYDSCTLRITLLEMIREAGVKLLLNTTFIESVMDGDRIIGVVVHDKSGFSIVKSKVFIDASGDGDLAATSGSPYEIGDAKGKTMPMTLMFRMSNIDETSLITYIKKNPDQFILAEDPYFRKLHPEHSLIENIHSLRDIPIVSGFYELIKHHQKTEQFPHTRKRLIIYVTPHPHVVAVNTTSILGKDGLDPEDLTNASVELHQQVARLGEFFQSFVPGFHNAWILDIAPAVGIRETRRIVGEYTIIESDVLSAACFNDTVAKGAYCIDTHYADGTIEHSFIQDGAAFSIPYRALIPRNIANVLLAGRCISASREAFGATREQVCCMTTGQAAGIAAAMCASSGLLPQDLSISELQKKLQTQGVIV
jgi:hypothetical protein